MPPSPDMANIQPKGEAPHLKQAHADCSKKDQLKVISSCVPWMSLFIDEFSHSYRLHGGRNNIISGCDSQASRHTCDPGEQLTWHKGLHIHTMRMSFNLTSHMTYWWSIWKLGTQQRCQLFLQKSFTAGWTLGMNDCELMLYHRTMVHVSPALLGGRCKIRGSIFCSGKKWKINCVDYSCILKRDYAPMRTWGGGREALLN